MPLITAVISASASQACEKQQLIFALLRMKADERGKL
jgi:hypothetical protein